MVVDSVAVVIPHFNRPDLVREAILSVREQTVKPAEVFVVDDGSSPENQQKLRSLPIWLKSSSIRKMQEFHLLGISVLIKPRRIGSPFWMTMTCGYLINWNDRFVTLKPILRSTLWAGA